MTRKQRWTVCACMLVLTGLVVLGAVWFWALFGMSKDVVSAWVVTGGVFGFATFLCGMWADLGGGNG